MKFLRIVADNFGPYKHIDVRLGDGIYGLLGKNGHGKSSLFDVVLYVFFEYSRDGVLSEIANRYLKPKQNPMCQVYFECNDNIYKATRGRKLFNDDGERLKIEKATAELKQKGRDKPLAVGASVTATIIDIIGMTPKVLMNTSVFMQDVQDEFLSARPSDRVKFIQEYYDLSVFARAYKYLKNEMRGAELKVAEYNGYITNAEEAMEDVDIDKLKKHLIRYKKEKDVAQKEFDTLKKQIDAYTSALKDRERRAVVEKEIERLKKVLKSELQLQSDNLKATAGVDMDVVVQEIKSVADNIGKLKATIAMEQSEIGTYKGLIAEYKRNVQLVQKASSCSVCTSKLTKVKTNKLILMYDKKVKNAEKEKSKHETELSKLDAKLLSDEKLHKRRSDRLHSLTQLRRNLQANAQSVSYYKKEILKNKNELAKLGGSTKAVNVATIKNVKQELDIKQATLDGAVKLFTDTQREIQEYEKYQKQKASTQRKLKAIEKQLEEDQILLKAFDKYGAPSDVTEVIIKMIEEYSNEELSKLTEDAIIRFDNFVQKKKSVSAGIEIWIHTAGESARYKTYSGGEKSLINFAVRVGMSQTQQEIKDVYASALLMDEVMGKLDDDNRANMIKVIQRLKDKFQQVLCITHTDLKEQFDNTIEFVKKSRISEVV